MNKVFLAFVLSILAACGASEGSRDSGAPGALEAARALWSEQGPRDYTYVLERECFCPREYLRPLRVRVADGEVASVAFVEGEGAVPEELADDVRTVAGWFDYIAKIRARRPHRLEVDYHAELGHPVRIYRDGHEKMADDETTLRIRDLRSGD